MTTEERSFIKQGDILKCIKGDWHFSKGLKYKVHDEDLVVWCDDLHKHLTRNLKLNMFEIIV